MIDFDLSILEDGLAGLLLGLPDDDRRRPHVSRGIYHANLSPGSDVKASLGRRSRVAASTSSR